MNGARVGWLYNLVTSEVIGVSHTIIHAHPYTK